ncbi:MAG: hypothetical protein ACD_29C00012G0002 [uncultured bacterium]|nr:MAG: hypothetical protein ACD_29C00012G0002 [uncultured bacterium]
MEWIKRIVLLSMVLFLSGCTLLGTYMSPQNPAPAYYLNGKKVQVDYVKLTPTWIAYHNATPVYRVGPYDILNVIVWDHPELTTITTQLSGASQSGFLVSAQGTIAFPFAGTFKVSGLTLPEIQAKIAQKISKYIRTPQVTVRVAAFRSQEAQLLGEVGAQVVIPLNDKPTSILDALNSVGGTNVTTANTTNIYVIRGNIKHLTVFALNVKSPQNMMLAQQFYLQNNDILYIPPLGVTSWNRIMSQILPSFGAYQTVSSTSAALIK